MKPLLVMFALLGMLLPSGAFAAGPGVINYQGLLKDSQGEPLTTTQSLRFRFYTAETGGGQITTFSDNDEVCPDAGGVFNALIGDDPDNKVPDVIFGNPNVWLDVQVNGDSVMPRMRLTTSPYACAATFADYAGDSSWLGGIPASQYATKASAQNAYFLTNGTSYLVVVTTASATANAASLKAAYAKAKTILPNQSPRSATNRMAVLLSPGRYDMQNSNLILDTEFIDLVGISNDPKHQWILGNGRADGVSTGVLHQIANDVHLKNLAFERTGPAPPLERNPVYYPETGLALTLMQNCYFHMSASMYVDEMTREEITYPGTYQDVTSNGRIFSFATCSGTFLRCSALYLAVYGNQTGTFTDCTGGDQSFSSNFYGGQVNSGTFVRCKGGDDSFTDTPSGTYIDCEGGENSFGDWTSGTFIRCIGGDYSFGHMVGGSVESKFYHCVGGMESFVSNGTHIGCIKNGVPYP